MRGGEWKALGYLGWAALGGVSECLGKMDYERME